MTQLFVSYPRVYRPVVEKLAADLRNGSYDLWFDDQLAGGQHWWSQILTRIEGCSSFLPIIGAAYLSSQACQLESTYAAALDRPFLPIAVAQVPTQLFPEAIASADWVDYDSAKRESVSTVMRAINGLQTDPPLPDPMPARPDVPLSYMTAPHSDNARQDEISRDRQG